MEITLMCKMDIVSNRGNILFKDKVGYKATIQATKAGSYYLVKDETGCFQTFQEDKAFKNHFKVLE